MEIKSSVRNEVETDQMRTTVRRTNPPMNTFKLEDVILISIVT